MGNMDVCEFSRNLLLARTLKTGGLYGQSSDALKKILKELQVVYPKTNDRKKLAGLLITYVKTNCACLNDIKQSKNFNNDFA